MEQLQLTEYVPSRRVRLAEAQRDSLRELVPSIQIAPSAGEAGFYDLTPGSRVGTICLDELTLEIRPKVAELDRVLFLISYALAPASWRDTGFDYGERRSLVEAVVPGFVRQLKLAFRRGVLQGYREEEEALLGVKGRLRFDDQIRERYGIFPPAEVRYDEFTADIELNRILKAALARLEKIRLRSLESRKSLRAFAGSLERVQLGDYHPAQLPEPSFDRLNEHYRSAIGLARLILASSSFELDRGSTRASCFLVDMNKVFEDFVVIALRERLSLSARSFPQNCTGRTLSLDVAGRIGLEPDISWWEGRKCLFVGDVKYKKLSASGIKHPDLYQLLAYTAATGLDRGLLIYASGESEDATHEISSVGKRLRVESLDLSGEPEEILQQISQMASLVSRMRAPSQQAGLHTRARAV